MDKLTKKQLVEITGGLSSPSKMPGFGYSLPAKECNVGGRLQQVEGSVCHGCYAMKGRYRFPNVEAAMYRRLSAISDDRWIDAMSELIRRTKNRWFRWHDSGDLQSLDHLEKIVEICKRTPEVRHWLPTRENRIVLEYLRSRGSFPENLNVRVSAMMVGGKTPKFAGLALTTSTVARNESEIDGHECPAPKQGNNCGDCRACWDSDVQNVAYHLH